MASETSRTLGTFLAGLVDGPVDELADAIIAPDWLRERDAEKWSEGFSEPRECCGECPRWLLCPWSDGKHGPTNPYWTEADHG